MQGLHILRVCQGIVLSVGEVRYIVGERGWHRSLVAELAIVVGCEAVEVVEDDADRSCASLE